MFCRFLNSELKRVNFVNRWCISLVAKIIKCLDSQAASNGFLPPSPCLLEGGQARLDAAQRLPLGGLACKGEAGFPSWTLPLSTN